MIDLLKHLFATPGAEPDAEPWATRFVAHQGLAALAMLAAMPWLSPLTALVVSLTVYAAWEAGQWLTARTALLWWDCALDWCAWALASWAVAWTVWGEPYAAAACVVASLVVLAVGVWRRS